MRLKTTTANKGQTGGRRLMSKGILYQQFQDFNVEEDAVKKERSWLEGVIWETTRIKVEC